MRVLGAGCWVLGAALLVAGCKAEDPPTPWEIVRGSATLAASKAVNESTYSQIVAFTGRSGALVVAGDSTLTGWYKLFPADSQHHFTGAVSFGMDAVAALSGVTPWKYRVITSPDFPDTYALVSDTVLTDDLVGDTAVERYRLYWEYHR